MLKPCVIALAITIQKIQHVQKNEMDSLIVCFIESGYQYFFTGISSDRICMSS